MNKWIYNFLRRPLWLLTDPTFAELNFCQNRIRACPRVEAKNSLFLYTTESQRRPVTREKYPPKLSGMFTIFGSSQPSPRRHVLPTLGIRHPSGCAQKSSRNYTRWSFPFRTITRAMFVQLSFLEGEHSNPARMSLPLSEVCRDAGRTNISRHWILQPLPHSSSSLLYFFNRKYLKKYN